ncbi:AIPR family protein [Nostoc sp. UIC 10890]
MSDKTTAFHIKQVEGEINGIFAELIDMSDCDGKKKNDKDNVLNSRALAAYSLHILAGVSPRQAAEAIVDGGEDNGIDGFLFNEKQKTLWLVQSKWIQNGQNSPKQNEMKTFKDGIFDFLDFDSKKAKRFNDKFTKREDEILAVTKTPGLKIKVVIAYTGSKLSTHARTVLEEDCIEILNRDNAGIASLEVFDLDAAYNAVIDNHKHEEIEVNFRLSNWGKIDEPYPAYYGQISAMEVVEWWNKYKNKLFSKNIRDFLGTSNVNSEISITLENEPRLFWYFNNGITVLCKDIDRLGAKTDKRLGDFVAKGISIVNGAQTIGSIGAFYEEASEEQKENLESAEIFIRFISLEKCQEDSFGLRVTKATNTQNKVEVRDFVALDFEQERLRKEFKTNGRNYHYKRAADTPARDENNYDLEEATVTLACGNHDVNLVITAKQDISKLWSDTSQAPYTSLFNSKVTAMQLWRQIEIKREIDNIITEKQGKIDNKITQDIIKYGNLLVLHLILKQIDAKVLLPEFSEDNFRDYKKISLTEILNKTLQLCKDYLDKNGSHSRLWMFFNSVNKSNGLKSFVLKNK